MKATESIIETDMRRQRRAALTRKVLHLLESTIRVRSIAPPDIDEAEIRVEFTDASARIIGVLAEAVDILESIIWASDGCVGHRQCAHSMEPWQRARALLAGKWEAYENPELQWPDPTTKAAL